HVSLHRRVGNAHAAWRRGKRAWHLSRQVWSVLEGFLSNLHQPSKGTAVAHGQVSQHLAVDRYSGLAKAVHQLVVRQPRLAGRRVDARDPQLAHLALAAAAVTERVGEGVQDRLVGGSKQQLLGKPEALRAIEDCLVTAMRGN